MGKGDLKATKALVATYCCKSRGGGAMGGGGGYIPHETVRVRVA